MSQQITIEIDDEVLQRAERVAALSGRDVGSVLSEVVATALPPVDALLGGIGDLRLLPDSEITRLAELQPDPQWDNRLSELLDHQQAGNLTTPEHDELQVMMREYGANLLLKSEALAEAVRRGLRAPLSP